METDRLVTEQELLARWRLLQTDWLAFNAKPRAINDSSAPVPASNDDDGRQTIVPGGQQLLLGGTSQSTDLLQLESPLISSDQPLFNHVSLSMPDGTNNLLEPLLRLSSFDTTSMNPTGLDLISSTHAASEQVDNCLVVGHQEGLDLNRPNESDDESVEAHSPYPNSVLDPMPRCLHPILMRWEALLSACVLFLFGLFSGVEIDHLDHRKNASNQYDNSPKGIKIRMEQVLKCANKLSAGRGFEENLLVTSPQQKAVDWFLLGAGSGVLLPDDDEHCQWNTPFGILYALIVLRGSIAVKERSWFSDVVVHNVSGVCAWKRITCEGQNIVKLEFNNANITGTIPVEISGLHALTTLRIYTNPKLIGTLPTELGRLDHLKDLFLQTNSLHGTVPSELGLLTNLQAMHLQQTQLTGVMPKQICQLRLPDLTASCAGDNPLLQCERPACCTACWN